MKIDILGISELKWTGMGKFNSNDHYIYYCGQEILRGIEWPYSQQKSSKCSTWILSHKRQNHLGSFSRQTIQHHSNLSLCPNHWCQRSWSWLVLWRPTTLSRPNTKKKKKVLFIIGDWNATVGNQEIPGVTGNDGLGVKN